MCRPTRKWNRGRLTRLGDTSVSAGAKSLIEAAGQSGCAGVKLRQQVALWRDCRGRGMKVVELYGRVRYAVQIEGLSRREAARQFGIDPRTVAKMLAFSVPPGYRRSRPPARPKLDPYTGIGRGGRTHRPRHGARVSYPCLRCRGSAR